MTKIETNTENLSKKTIFINTFLILLTILAVVFGVYTWQKNIEKNQNNQKFFNTVSFESNNPADQNAPYNEENNDAVEQNLGQQNGQDNFNNDPIANSVEHQRETNTYKYVLATVFWVGEPATADNGYIANDKSAWDASWKTNFGGYDDPGDRCGYKPCDFSPKENTFYFALPYNDLTNTGERKASAVQIPWFSESQHKTTILKNSWIEINLEGNTCYAQWQDVGPFEMDDFDYVFGAAPPKNQFGEKAGLDLSPAVRDCLQMTTNHVVGWRFVAYTQVPSGPWKQIVTTSDAAW